MNMLPEENEYCSICGRNFDTNAKKTVYENKSCCKECLKSVIAGEIRNKLNDIAEKPNFDYWDIGDILNLVAEM